MADYVNNRKTQTYGFSRKGLFRLRQRLRRDKLGLFWVCFAGGGKVVYFHTALL